MITNSTDNGDLMASSGFQKGPYNYTDPDLRSPGEIITFLSIDIFLTICRVVAAIYFILMTWKHLNYQGDRRDKFTYYTFMLLGLSVLSLVAYHISEIVEQMYIWVY